MQQGWLTKTFKGDKAIWGLVALFMIYSLLAVYSSSVGVAFMKYGGNTTYFLKSQFFMLLLSLVIIVVVHYLPYRIYFSMAGLILIGSVVLLVLTFALGSRVNEATRSIIIPGTGFRLQTSDVAKVALVLYLARSLAKYQKELKNFILVTKYFILPIGIVCGLIMPENLSTALMVFGMSMIIMFIGRVPVKFLLAYIGMGVVGVLFFAMVLTVVKKDNRVQVWKNRIEQFISGKGNEDGDYQSNQAKIAISTGGLFGKAPGKSTQRNMLPQSNSDFIFAIIIEEYGLLFGAIPLILAYMILLFRGITIAKKCETAFPAFLVLGLIVMIVIQAMLNMMVAVGLFPVTGQTLPMVSWGRTSVLVMSFSIGAILSVSRVVNARIKKEELPEEEISDEGEKYMSRQKHSRVIISGGGTGGHIFPAISIANALRRIDPETEILFVGAEGRMEMEKIPAAGYRIIGLPVAGLYRSLTMKNFSVLIKLLKSLNKAKKVIKEFGPDVVVGVGGYASGPILRQAGRMGIPTLIQEQNSYAGVTNKLLAKKASAICVAYDGMEKYFPPEKIIKTGNPVRQNFENLKKMQDNALTFFNLKKEFPVILVLGGSLGAGSINNCMSENINKLRDSDCQWLWQTGKYYYENVRALVSLSFSGNISVHGFINRMDYAYAAADIIISRAGAGTISELCLVGKPVILVPSPNVAEDHQTRNAEALSTRSAAMLITDNSAGKILVDEAIKLVSDSTRRKEFSENILKMADRNADIRIAEEVLKLAVK